MLEPIFEPMPGKVVVEAIKASQFLVNRGGVQIFASEVGGRPRTTGVVLAVPAPWRQGEGEPELESFLQPGDHVIFGQHSGVEVEYGRKKVIILREIEVLTKVKAVEPEDLKEIGVASQGFDDLP